MFPPHKPIRLNNKIQAEPPLKFSFIDKKTKNVTFANEDQKNPKHAVLLGKIEETSETNNLFNYNAWIDTDFPSIVMVYGRRGTGKSYTLGCIAEGLISDSNNISALPNSQTFFQSLSYLIVSVPPNSRQFVGLFSLEV